MEDENANHEERKESECVAKKKKKRVENLKIVFSTTNCLRHWKSLQKLEIEKNRIDMQKKVLDKGGIVFHYSHNAKFFP